MIGKNWMKAFAVAGASVAVAAVMPAVSEARTHYTGKTPAGITAMADTAIIPPAYMTTAVSTKHTALTKVSTKHKKLKHKTATTASARHKAHKIVKKTALKKKPA